MKLLIAMLFSVALNGQENIEIPTSFSLEQQVEVQTGMPRAGLSANKENLEALVQLPAVTLSEPPKENTYEQLPLTGDERQKIGLILKTLAENNVVNLLFEKKHLERLGHDINHVHPLRFLGTVFKEPRLVYFVRQIRRSTFKWRGFIDGFSSRFNEEIKEGNVNAYLPGLAESLNVRVEEIQSYVNYQDFEGLVIFLLEKNRRE